MCGIAGILKRKDTQPIEPADLEKLIRPIEHRGPDGSGSWLHTSALVGLAHRRLSIIDLSENGAQPFHRPDLGLSITFNGEIYNYIEVRGELVKKGYTFKTETDTEVILAAYKAYGYDCLRHFDGMFAFALWDENKQELFCARDRFGEKPFHYHLDNNGFVFASEIKQLWAYGIPKKWDPAKIEHFLTEAEVIDDNDPAKTFFSNVLSLKAAHYLVCTPDLKLNIVNYWNLGRIKINTAIGFEEAVKQFHSLFSRSVGYRLRSDVAIGSSLSGGLDSSAIVYTVNKEFLQPGQAQHTFSARFKNYHKDEGEFIDALTSELQTISRHDVYLDSGEFEQDIDAIIYHQDEPFQSASIFAQYKVMQLARRNNVTVLLDGQGADELLGGYETLYVDRLKQLFHNQPEIYRTEVSAYNEMHGAKYGAVDLERNDTMVMKLKRSAKRLLNRDQAVPSGYFSKVLREYIGGAQLQQLLRYVDRNSMAHSVETRLPFLSHELVEFCFSLPDDFKMKDGWTKLILRKDFDKKLPDKITWRKNKVGFETPESEFLASEKAVKRIGLARDYMASHHIQAATVSNDWLLFMAGSYLN